MLSHFVFVLKIKIKWTFTFCSTQNFCSHWAHLKTFMLSFNKCVTLAKLPTWQCLPLGSMPPKAWLRTISKGMVASSPPHGIIKITLKVVIFHLPSPRWTPTYSTPLKSFHKIELKSSSTRFSFPIDFSKLIPLAMVLHGTLSTSTP